MPGIKMTGKFADTVEKPEAVSQFYHFWMPYDTPENWAKAWEDFKLGLHDTGWISDWQLQNWTMPQL